MPGVALCVTVVAGLTVDEALVRFDGFPARRTATLQDLMEVSRAAPFPYPQLACAVDVDGHVVLVEENGYHGAQAEVLRRLSAGTSVTSVYWNVNFSNRLSYAENGRLVASVDWARPGHGDGDDPEELKRYLDGLGFDEIGDPRPKALAFLERCGGVRITREHLVGAHPASVLVPADLFEPRGGLGILIPGGVDLVRLVGLPPTRESVRSPLLPKAYRGAVEVAVDGLLPTEEMTVDPSALPDADRELRRAELLKLARRGYRRGVEDAWAWYEADGDGAEPVGGGIEDLIAELATEEPGYGLVRVTFTHAVARSRLHPDPSTALSQVLINAAKADPDGTAVRRERALAYLSGFAARSGE
ncbi:DUF6461 domain-containing protein [Micromonospora sp. NPDC047812]|uniref:DUF6461 domain-containing protein n=1 Tax=Micromonospora sp. NPDC047812 TaxID=3155742 RepID=UPI003452FF8C